MNCKHCGSKYTKLARTYYDSGNLECTYECESCKKSFKLIAPKDVPGTWLMTIRNQLNCVEAEIYKTESGELYINVIDVVVASDQWKYSKAEITFSGQKMLHYDLRSDVITTPRSGWANFIELNPCFVPLALENEAMKILHKGGNLFGVVGSIQLMDDARTWLRMFLGTSPNSNTGTSPNSNTGGCYVATAVYGSYDCPQVWTLRRYRDNVLAETWYGRAFIKTYYAISPTLVKWFGDTTWFKTFWRSKLDRMVKNLQDNGCESTPYQDKNW